MHAIVVNHPGGPEVLEYTEVPLPPVRPGWTRVKVRGFGINHSEIFRVKASHRQCNFRGSWGSKSSARLTQPVRLNSSLLGKPWCR